MRFVVDHVVAGVCLFVFSMAVVLLVVCGLGLLGWLGPW